MSAGSIDEALRELVAEMVRAELAKQAKAPANDEYLSTRKAGEFASVAPGTVRRWVRAGKLDGYHAGGELRVKRSDLERLLRTPPSNDDGDLTPEEHARRRFG